MFENSMWIKARKDYGDVCPVFRYDFEFEQEVARAVLNITAMGVYEAELNGKRIGNFIMAPGWTAYDKRHQYQSYDITPMLKEKNTIEVTVGKGWYRGRICEDRITDGWGGVSAIIAEIDIQFTDGTEKVIVSDDNWKTAQSPIRFSEIYDGEIYDATFSDVKWETAGFFWFRKDLLIPQEGEYVIEHETIMPQRMITTPKGERVIDFGQNITGYIEIEADATFGEKIEYSHAEELDADGNFYTENLRTAKAKIEYICRDGKQKYKPHFTFMGFRYIRIDSAPENITMDNFRAIVVHSEMKRTGDFKCSNAKINKLFSNIIWGQRDNFFDIPSDCPQRDERLGWTGDAQIFVKTAAYNFDVKKFFRKWLHDLKAEQTSDGSVPSVVPNIFGNAALGRPAWSDAAVICPWQLYLSYGDTQVLEEQIDSMIAWVEYMRRDSSEYLWLNETHYGDWLGLDNTDGSYKGASDYILISCAFFAYSTGLLIKALKSLGRPTAEYEELYKNIVKAFNNRFTEYKTQTECALALYFDIAEDKKRVADRLAKLVKENGNKLTTGFVGTPYLLPALSENGYTELAYSLLLQEEFPSWLFSVNMGATTIWEHWDGRKANGEFWSANMNSFNHYAYGAVGAWMYETVAGIRIDEEKPGFENVILEPVPDRRLDWAEASVVTKHGTVRSKWYYDENDNIHYEFDVPNTATIILNGEKKQVNKGRYCF